MNLKTVKAIIFDFDGVIADTVVDIADAVNKTLENFGFTTLPVATVLSFTGDGAVKLLQRALEAADKIEQTSATFRDIYQWYLQYYESHCVAKTVLYPGMENLLELLNIKNIPVAIVSNKPWAVTDAIVKKLNIAHLFATVIGPEQTAHVKPNPEGILLAIKTINEKLAEHHKAPLRLEEVLMVGDSATDIQAGKNAGIKTCAVTGGYGNKEKLRQATPDMELVLASELMVPLGEPDNHE